MAGQHSPADTRVRFVFGEAIGSFLVVLAVAQQERLFEKYGVSIDPVPARGATVPRVTPDTPMGLIGEPAGILQAAGGADLRILASLGSIPLSGHLVGRPGIATPDDLRDKRVGVRVVGAGVWISTVLALKQLGLDPARDRIATVPTGSPGEILRALERGDIDAALVTVAQSHALQAKGYTALLTDYPAGMTAYGGCLAATAQFMSAHAEIAQAVTAALTEGIVFSLAERNSEAVMQAFRTALDVTDTETALNNLRELRPKPYPSRDALARMQAIIATHEPRAASVNLEAIIDDRFVRGLDESGAIDRLYEAYGPRRMLDGGR